MNFKKHYQTKETKAKSLKQKTITSENIIFERQLTNFSLFHGKFMFHSREIQIFILSTIPSTFKVVMQ